MHFKARAKSEELLILDSLSKRMNLSDQDKLYYLNLTKGYEGELIFDSLTEDLAEEYLILNDLLLSFNKTTFQIDSLMIGLNKAYFYEVKNYEGDFYYESEKIYKKPKTEITNPLNQ
ncbi:NERD domain-containing protein, partial [Butyricicoccus sp. 1XD8-22]